jgi:uncharacterized protein YbjQ (UPF0145 family)
MKRKHFMLAATAVMTLAGCATQVVSLPLGPVVAQPAAGSSVAIYFGSQPHPAVANQLGQASHSVRIARAEGGNDVSCNKVLADALDELRADAQKKGANAVINVKTRFHTTESDSATDYTCGVSQSAAAIAVSGDLVVLTNN